MKRRGDLRSGTYIIYRVSLLYFFRRSDVTWRNVGITSPRRNYEPSQIHGCLASLRSRKRALSKQEHSYKTVKFSHKKQYGSHLKVALNNKFPTHVQSDLRRRLAQVDLRTMSHGVPHTPAQPNRVSPSGRVLAAWSRGPTQHSRHKFLQVQLGRHAQRQLRLPNRSDF